jgi:hypothetical protein
MLNPITNEERQRTADLLVNTDDSPEAGSAFAATLLLICINTLGEVVLNGEYGTILPQTLASELKRNYNIDLPPENLGKIMAAISVITTDNLTRSLPSFLATIHGLIGDGTDWTYEEPLDIEDIAWAIMEATLLWPPEEELNYSPEIIGYVQLMLSREGLKSTPAILAFARDEENNYSDVGQFDDDIVQEQASRLEAINEYVEQQQHELLTQLESIPSLKVSAESIVAAINAELVEINDSTKWM